MKEYLTYDDVQIVPKYSDIQHRDDCNIISRVSRNVHVEIPLVSSPMDTITELDMAMEMSLLGGMGFIHRFMTIDNQSSLVNISHGISVGASIGVTGDYIERAQELVINGCKVILIDVAHGHHVLVEVAIEKIRQNVKGDFDIAVGNIATKEAAKDLCKWGADSIRVGVGGGSLCSTRIQTGVGIPMITSLVEVVSVCDDYDVPVIADGGIRTPGDVAKAISAGADCVMLGNLLSGTKETPGLITKTGVWPNEVLHKKYRGSASLEAKLDRGELHNVEGYSTTVIYKGKVKRIINDIVDGLKSSMAYVGASNLEEFQSLAEFIRVTSSGIHEASPFGLYN